MKVVRFMMNGIQDLVFCTVLTAYKIGKSPCFIHRFQFIRRKRYDKVDQLAFVCFMEMPFYILKLVSNGINIIEDIVASSHEIGGG